MTAVAGIASSSGARPSCSTLAQSTSWQASSSASRVPRCLSRYPGTNPSIAMLSIPDQSLCGSGLPCTSYLPRPRHSHALHATRRPLASLLPSPPPPPAPSGEGGGGKPSRRLILMRHADSANPRNVRDHDRPISDLGKQQAAEIARILQQRGWVPDIVLASNARRTRQTLDEMAQVMDALGDVDTHLYGSLYTVAALDGQTREHIEECLLEVVDDQRNFCVAVVGHNKGMEEAASQLAGEVVKLKTASVALLQGFAHSWKDVLSVAAEAASTTSPASSPPSFPPAVALAAGPGPGGMAQAQGQGVLCGGPSQGAGKAAAGSGAGAGSVAGAASGWRLIDVITPGCATS